MLRVKILLIVGMEEADKIDTLENHVSKPESAAWKIHITNRKFRRNIGPDNKIIYEKIERTKRNKRRERRMRTTALRNKETVSLDKRNAVSWIREA